MALTCCIFRTAAVRVHGVDGWYHTASHDIVAQPWTSASLGVSVVVVDALHEVLQVGLAADWLRRDIIGVAESGGLQAQAYWLSTTLALGAFLKVIPVRVRR